MVLGSSHQILHPSSATYLSPTAVYCRSSKGGTSICLSSPMARTSSTPTRMKRTARIPKDPSTLTPASMLCRYGGWGDRVWLPVWLILGEKNLRQVLIGSSSFCVTGWLLTKVLGRGPGGFQADEAIWAMTLWRALRNVCKAKVWVQDHNVKENIVNSGAPTTQWSICSITEHELLLPTLTHLHSKEFNIWSFSLPPVP